MKKAIIALAVAAGSIAAAQADTTTLYGEIGYAAPFNFGNISADDVKIKDNISAGLNNSALTKTKFGIKGEEDLGSGVSAFFQYEFKVGTDSVKEVARQNGVRPNPVTDAIYDSVGNIQTSKAFIGFKGDFGKVTLGKQDSVWSDFTGKANYFNADSVIGGYTDLGYDFYNGVRYDVPEMSGVAASLSYDLRGKTAEVGLGYNLEGIDLGAALQYNVGGFDDSMGNRSAEDQSHYRVGVSGEYAADMFKVAADYQFKPETVKDRKDARHLVGLGAGYNVTADSTLYGVAQLEVKDFSDNVQKFGLGYEYNLSKRTRTWVEAGVAHLGENKDINRKASNNFQMSVGVRHKF